MSRKLVFDARATEDLLGLPRHAQQAVWRRLQDLKQNPQGPGTRALAGNLKGLRRLRIGDYRAAYCVDDEAVRVLVVGHRNRFYEIATRRSRS
jgi:addiction module RelE/StbE family toxin